MSEEFRNLLVGLIVIEPLAADRRLDIACEATLGQFLSRLAIDVDLNCERAHSAETDAHELRLFRHESRFGGWPTTCWDGTSRLSANLDHLTTELELALTRIRSTLAAACDPAAE